MGNRGVPNLGGYRYWLLLASFSFIFLSLSACHQKNNDTAGLPTEAATPQIVNATNVVEKSDLSQIAVLIFIELPDGFSSLCTGVLLDDHYILSAAHCKSEDAVKMYAMFSKDFYEMESDEVYDISEIYIHPDYKPRGAGVAFGYRNDIALYQLSKPAPKNHIRTKIFDDQKMPPRFEFWALGYGASTGENIDDSGEGVLRQKTLHARDYSNDLPYFMVHQKQGGVCIGDSGGPALIKRGSSYYVVGTVSSALYGSNQDRCSSEAIYMNSQYYVSWIKSIISSFESKKPF